MHLDKTLGKANSPNGIRVSLENSPLNCLSLRKLTNSLCFSVVIELHEGHFVSLEISTYINIVASRWASISVISH